MEAQFRRHLRRGQFGNGQALIYGLFMLAAASTALYFMVFAGNLANEKTKLVNTADAVAYSAGVMHARALNFDASINRAMIANEALVAQLVSIASWMRYSTSHAQNAPALNCGSSLHSVPVELGLVRYAPVCAIASQNASKAALQATEVLVDATVPTMMSLTSLAQASLQTSQATMLQSLGIGGLRSKVLQEVADANYAGLGKVRVDPIPLEDGFFNFDGSGPVISLRTKDERERFKEVAVNAAYRDEFVKERRWDSNSPWPCILPRGKFKRRGGTEMIGLDEWKAMDTSSLHREKLGFLKCKSQGEFALGAGAQSAAVAPSGKAGSFGGALDNPVAAAGVSTLNWNYKGLPNFFELSKNALEYKPDHQDKSKRELRVIFSIRVTRAIEYTTTPDGAAKAKPHGRLAVIEGAEADRVLAAVSTSEVYFERPANAPRLDGQLELASLFNPYWQARLRATPPATITLARALQEAK